MKRRKLIQLFCIAPLHKVIICPCRLLECNSVSLDLFLKPLENYHLADITTKLTQYQLANTTLLYQELTVLRIKA